MAGSRDRPLHPARFRFCPEGANGGAEDKLPRKRVCDTGQKRFLRRRNLSRPRRLAFYGNLKSVPARRFPAALDRRATKGLVVVAALLLFPKSPRENGPVTFAQATYRHWPERNTPMLVLVMVFNISVA